MKKNNKMIKVKFIIYKIKFELTSHASSDLSLILNFLNQTNDLLFFDLSPLPRLFEIISVDLQLLEDLCKFIDVLADAILLDVVHCLFELHRLHSFLHLRYLAVNSLRNYLYLSRRSLLYFR